MTSDTSQSEPAVEPRVVRVFISSTFRDMHAERDHLSRFVFPELRSRCLKRGADFIGLDLRWGVTEEEAQQEGALAICLKEIERCRPFFVCLLGSRFGWVPPPEEIPQEFFVRVAQLEIMPASVTDWYRLDVSSVPVVYRLRRDDKLPNDVAEQIASYWESKGLPLAGESITSREIIRAVFEAGYPRSHALFYLRPAGIERDAKFPQRLLPAFVEQDTNRRKKLAALKRRIRNSRNEIVVRRYNAAYAGMRIDSSLLPVGLSDHDRQALTDGIVGPSEWPGLSERVKQTIEVNGTVALEGMEELGRQVLDDLWAAIERELERPAQAIGSHAQERGYHERFIRDRTRAFLGRQDILDRMVEYTRDPDDRKPLVVTGDPGGGKSALMAKCAALQREEMPDALVIPHFIGASPGSTMLGATLRSLCETLKRECQLEDEIPVDPEKLKQLFGVFLAKAGEKRDIVLVLDALNQLDPAGRSHELGWLPDILAPRVKVIVSTLAGDCLDRLRQRLPDEHIIDVPRLERHHQETLVSRHLMLRRKRLSNAQLQSLLDTGKRPDVGLPLYVLVALEELSLFGDYEALSNRIENLPPRLPELFQQVLGRLEQDHGREMTESICRWMAVSRSGMLESEILDLLSRGGEFPRVKWTRFYRALEFYLRPIGEEGEGSSATALLDFYHDQLRLAVYRRYLGMDLPESEPTGACRGSHRELVGYFRQIASDDGDPRMWHTERPRGLSELPYHQTRGEMWQDLETTLCDLGFIGTKCAAGMTDELVADYNAALASLPEAREEREHQRELDERVTRHTVEMIEYAKRWSDARDQYERDPARFTLPAPEDIPLPEPPASIRVWTEEEIEADAERIASAPSLLDRVRAFGQFVSAESHLLARFGSRPGFCLQQAYNSASTGPIAAATKDGVAAWNGPPIFLLTEACRPLWNPYPACLKTLECFTTSVAITVDGRRAVSGSFGDNTLRVWDLESGECVKTLEGHRDTVNSVALSADGRRAVSGSTDKTLRVWDLDSGQCLKLIQGDAGGAVAATPDLRRVVSGSRDGRLHVWDLESGQCVKTIDGHTAAVYSVAMTADGRRAVSGSEDRTLRVWDLDSGQCLKTIKGHADPICAVALTADGRRAVSGSGFPHSLKDRRPDNTLRVWDLESGKCLWDLEWGEGLKRHSYTGYSDEVHSVALTADGRCAVSGSNDNRLRIWDLESGDCVKTLVGLGAVDSVALTADGRRAISGGFHHKTLHVWDLESGGGIEMREGNANAFEAVALTPDGRRAVSGEFDTLRVWDLDSGQCLKVFKWLVTKLITGFVTAVAVTVDGRRAVSGCGDNRLRVWDLDRGKCVLELKCAVQSVVLTLDGRRAVSASGALRVWDLDSGHLLLETRGTHSANSVALTPDGQRAVSGATDNALRVWDLDSGQCLKVLEGHTDRVHSVAVSADGRRAVSASQDKTLRVWDLESGQCLQMIEGHTDVVYSVAVTADGRRAVSRSGDKTLRVWDLDSGQCLSVVPSTGPASPAVGRVVVAGSLEVFRLSSPLLTGPAWVTAARVWRFGEGRSPGHWDDQLSVTCPSCDQRFTSHQAMLDVIEDIASQAGLQFGQSPCESLPAEAWHDPRLLSECPACHWLLRFNPFILDGSLTDQKAIVEEAQRLVSEGHIAEARQLILGLRAIDDQALEIKVSYLNRLDEAAREYGEVEKETSNVLGSLELIGLNRLRIEALARDNNVDLNNVLQFNAFLRAVLEQLPPPLRAQFTHNAVQGLSEPASIDKPAKRRWWQFLRR